MNHIITALVILLISSCGSNTPSETTMDRTNKNFVSETKKPQKPSTNELDSAAQNLLYHQRRNFDRILKELQDDKKKTSHWIWWVFPTEVPGKSEPNPKSSVAVNQVDGVLANANMEKWTRILEMIASLLESHPIAGDPTSPNESIIPDIDHGRIAFALDFWLKKVAAKTKKYDGFYQVLQRLDKFKWR